METQQSTKKRRRFEPRTLVLTPWHAPHRIVSWKIAVCDWYTGKVEILASYPESVSSPSITMKVPAVVRCLRATPAMKRHVKFSRVNVYERDGWKCAYCDTPKPMHQLTYDHVVPRAKGGKTDWGNIVTACRPCNRKKGDRTPEQAGMKLLRLPHKPKALPMPTRFDVEQMPEWEGWVPKRTG